MDNDSKNKGVQKISTKRILAIIALLIIALCLAGLLINAFTGGSESVTMALLFCLIVIPTIIYIFIKFASRHRE